MKKDIERLLIFLVPAVVLGKVLQTASASIFAEVMDGKSTSLGAFPDLSIGSVFALANIATNLAALLPAIVIAMWVWQLEKRQNGRPLLWALGAVAMNYWILLLFFGQMLLKEYRPHDTDKT